MRPLRERAVARERREPRLERAIALRLRDELACRDFDDEDFFFLAKTGVLMLKAIAMNRIKADLRILEKGVEEVTGPWLPF